MKKPLTIILAVLFISISILGICLSLSCGSNSEPEVNEQQKTVTLEEAIQQDLIENPGPQATYIVEGSVEQIDNRTLFIERIDGVTVIAEVKAEIRAETLDELQEGSLFIPKPMAFRDIVIGDTVKLWVQIMSDGSFEQTRLLVNTP